MKVYTPMKTNPVKRTLKAGKPSFGTWLSLGDLYATRVLARAGFDWLTLDMEHSPIDWAQAAAIFAVHRRGRLRAALPRAGGERTITSSGRSMPGPGASSCRWSTRSSRPRRRSPPPNIRPNGNRSLGGGMHALNFDATAAEYFRQANDEILVILQTESPHGHGQRRGDLRLPGVDAIFVGPVDLRANMRAAPTARKPTDEEFEAMLAKVVDSRQEDRHADRHAHAWIPKPALPRAEQGMQFIAIGSELRFMTQKAQEMVRAVQPDGAERNWHATENESAARTTIGWTWLFACCDKRSMPIVS